MTVLSILILVVQVLLAGAVLALLLTLRATKASVARTEAKLGRVLNQVRETRREVRHLNARLRESEVETGITALNRYMLLASRSHDDGGA